MPQKTGKCHQKGSQPHPRGTNKSFKNGPRNPPGAPWPHNLAQGAPELTFSAPEPTFCRFRRPFSVVFGRNRRSHKQLTTLKESVYIRYIPILDDHSLAHVHHTLAVLHNKHNTPQITVPEVCGPLAQRKYVDCIAVCAIVLLAFDSNSLRGQSALRTELVFHFLGPHGVCTPLARVFLFWCFF